MIKLHKTHSIELILLSEDSHKYLINFTRRKGLLLLFYKKLREVRFLTQLCNGTKNKIGPLNPQIYYDIKTTGENHKGPLSVSQSSGREYVPVCVCTRRHMHGGGGRGRASHTDMTASAEAQTWRRVMCVSGGAATQAKGS